MVAPPHVYKDIGSGVVDCMANGAYYPYRTRRHDDLLASPDPRYFRIVPISGRGLYVHDLRAYYMMYVQTLLSFRRNSYSLILRVYDGVNFGDMTGNFQYSLPLPLRIRQRQGRQGALFQYSVP